MNDYYHKFLKLESDSIVYKLMGEIFIAKGQDEEAISYLNESLKLDPEQAGIHNALGELYMKQDKLDEAFGHYSQSLDIQSDQFVVHNILGLIQMQNFSKWRLSI